MKTSILAVWNTIKTSLSNVWTNLKETASSKFNGVVDFFKKAVDKVKGFFKGLGTSIKNVFTSIVSSVKTPIQTVIGILNGFIGGAEKIINKVVGAINKIPNINLPKKLGGWSLGIPEMKLVEFGRIPGLAEGGTVTETGTVMVGEQGPEFLNLPRGASVVPLDKSGSVNITINNPHIFNERDAEKLGNLLVRHMKMKGINPRGV
jgi:phage-related protein